MNEESEMEDLGLATLLGGRAVEKFDMELSRVLQNILDPNTPAKAPRKVKLEVTIKPTENRTAGAVRVTVTSDLAGDEAAETLINIGRVSGRPVAYELVRKQQGLFDAGDPGPKVVGLRGEG